MTSGHEVSLRDRADGGGGLLVHGVNGHVAAAGCGCTRIRRWRVDGRIRGCISGCIRGCDDRCVLAYRVSQGQQANMAGVAHRGADVLAWDQHDHACGGLRRHPGLHPKAAASPGSECRMGTHVRRRESWTHGFRALLLQCRRSLQRDQRLRCDRRRLLHGSFGRRRRDGRSLLRCRLPNAAG